MAEQKGIAEMTPPENMSRIEARMDEHIKESTPVRITVAENKTNICNLSKWLNKLDSKLDRLTLTHVGINISTVISIFAIIKWA